MQCALFLESSLICNARDCRHRQHREAKDRSLEGHRFCLRCECFGPQTQRLRGRLQFVGVKFLADARKLR